MQRFFVYPEWLDSRNPKDKIEVVKCADHEQALAEKDREIEYLQECRISAAAMDAQRIIEYQQLMEKAVQFAREWQNPTGYPSQVEAYQFLQSPEVQAWKEHKP